MKRFLFLFAGGLSLLLASVPRTQAYQVERPSGENTGTVRVVLPWEGSDDELTRRLADLRLSVGHAGREHVLPLSGGSLASRDYVQFGSWLLPLPEGTSVARFGMVRRREALLPIASIEAALRTVVLPAVERPRQDVVIRPAENGRVAFEGRAVEGLRVDVSALLRSLYVAIERGESSVPATVVADPPRVEKVDLPDLRVEELIGTGVSDFSGSPENRMTNIRVGVSRFDGIIIRQGEEFSFNNQLGPVDGKHGFEPELVIVGPRTQKEFGGGLCQVSSTMFRAALYAGLPVTARRNHSYAVQYYQWPEGWGFDATIYPGVQDLKFVNDTPGDIAVHATIEGQRVYYRFYGISDGRRVSVTAPSTYNHRGAPATQTIYVPGMAPGTSRVREKPHAGFTASFRRTVILSDGSERNETFTSVYQARPKVIETGTPQGSDAPTPTPEVFYTGDIN